MPAILGLRGTGDFGTDERPKSFNEMILWKNPNGTAPLTALMSKMRRGTITDPEHNWWEETLAIVRVQLDGGGSPIAAGTTTLTLVSGGYSLSPGDVLMVELTTESATFANEFMQVTAVASDTSITVTRGVAGTTAASIADSSYVMVVSSAWGEGTNSPEASTSNPTKLYNYAQIQKTSYELTNTTGKTKTRTGDPMANDKKRAMFKHSTKMELMFLFGNRYETTDSGNGKPLRFCGGLMYFLVNYNAANGVKIYSSAPTANSFLDDVYKVFDYDAGTGIGNERLVLCGNAALNQINKILKADGTIFFQEKVSAYGMTLMRYDMPQGTFYFKTHPLMNLHSIYSKSMFIIDPTGIKYLPFRDTVFQDNIQAPGADTRKGQWIGEVSASFHNLETMKYLGNIG